MDRNKLKIYIVGDKRGKRDPKSLFECASRMVGIIIAKPALDIFEKYADTSHISAEERRDLELLIAGTAKHFDDLLPVSLHNIITQKSLQYIAPKFRFIIFIKNDLNFLDIVLRSHTTDFDICVWPHEMRIVLYRSLHRLKNLQNLKLEPIYYPNEGFVYGTREIKNMKNLETFEFRSCCDDVIKVVCDNCPLRKLIVHYSQVTDLSVPSILKLQNLVELDIYMSCITEDGCVKLLLGLPNLTVIYCNYLNSYLAQINSDSIKLPIQATKYHCVTQQDITNLTKYCPLISKLDLIFQGESKDVSSLAVLKHLKSLFIFSSSILYVHVKHLLESKGNQLTQLHICQIVDISERGINKIKRLCPNAETLIVN